MESRAKIENGQPTNSARNHQTPDWKRPAKYLQYSFAYLSFFFSTLFISRRYHQSLSFQIYSGYFLLFSGEFYYDQRLHAENVFTLVWDIFVCHYAATSMMTVSKQSQTVHKQQNYVNVQKTVVIIHKIEKKEKKNINDITLSDRDAINGVGQFWHWFIMWLSTRCLSPYFYLCFIFYSHINNNNNNKFALGPTNHLRFVLESWTCKKIMRSVNIHYAHAIKM